MNCSLSAGACLIHFKTMLNRTSSEITRKPFSLRMYTSCLSFSKGYCSDSANSSKFFKVNCFPASCKDDKEYRLARLSMSTQSFYGEGRFRVRAA